MSREMMMSLGAFILGGDSWFSFNRWFYGEHCKPTFHTSSNPWDNYFTTSYCWDRWTA